jgi:hypothetical protein
MSGLNVEIEFTVTCSDCGADLSASFDYNKYARPSHIISVEPCQSCLDKAEKDGRDGAEI